MKGSFKFLFTSFRLSTGSRSGKSKSWLSDVSEWEKGNFLLKKIHWFLYLKFVYRVMRNGVS